jgi:hypoxanthine phosphoribosyltransferase
MSHSLETLHLNHIELNKELDYYYEKKQEGEYIVFSRKAVENKKDNILNNIELVILEQSENNFENAKKWKVLPKDKEILKSMEKTLTKFLDNMVACKAKVETNQKQELLKLNKFIYDELRSHLKGMLTHFRSLLKKIITDISKLETVGCWAYRKKENVSIENVY